MTLYRIYAKKIASRRYQVMAAYETANPEVAAHVYRPGQADWYMGPRDPEIALLSPRPYPKGCIVNPSKIIRELIAARRESVKCIDHLDFVSSVCPDCGEQVDPYGNTANQFDYCSFPDCGCDGERLCMAPSGASIRAFEQNVEGMWSGKTMKQRKAVFALMGTINENVKP